MGSKILSPACALYLVEHVKLEECDWVYCTFISALRRYFDCFTRLLTSGRTYVFTQWTADANWRSWYNSLHVCSKHDQIASDSLAAEPLFVFFRETISLSQR